MDQMNCHRAHFITPLAVAFVCGLGCSRPGVAVGRSAHGSEEGSAKGVQSEAKWSEANAYTPATPEQQSIGAAHGRRRRVTQSHWVTGYYVGYQADKHPPNEIDWNGLSHLVLGAARAAPDGSLDLTFFRGNNAAGAALARDVTKRAHVAGKDVLLMLGGAGNGLEIMSAVRNHRDEFIDNLIKAVNDFGFDGIDLDWEGTVDMPQYVELAKSLRAALPNAILTAPGYIVNSNFQSVDPKVAKLAEQLDQYNLMSYYPATAMTGSGWMSWHNCPLEGMKGSTPISIADSLERHVAAGVPKSKLGMGVAFYAICYTGGVTAPNQPTNEAAILGGDNDYQLSELFGRGGPYSDTVRHWDMAALVPYLSLATPERHGCRYISYEDEQSLEAKGKFVKRHGYGGTIVWTISQGYLPERPPGQRNPLMGALKRGFLD